MTPSRRQLLKATLGAAQFAVLERAGLLGQRASAQPRSGPIRMLTIFFRGGWMPSYFFSPLRPDQVSTFMPAPTMGAIPGESRYYTRQQIETNLDGTPNPGGTLPRPIVVPRTWNEAAMAAGQRDPRATDPRTGLPTNPHGYSWVHHRLWENTVVVHGVDQGTAAHSSGIIAGLCGVAGPEFRAPAMGAVVANGLMSRFPDRPLPSVTLSEVLRPNHYNLPTAVAPTIMPNLAAVANTLSERNASAWTGLRDRTSQAQLDYSGRPAPAVATHTIDDFVLAQTRSHRATTNAATDDYLQRFHDGLLGVSRTISNDVLSAIEGAAGVQHTPVPFWAGLPSQHFSVAHGSSNLGSPGAATYDLALKLMKRDMVSSLIIPAEGLNNYNWDSHALEPTHWTQLRSTMDLIGRFLGEMKMTPGTSGNGSLLDETLVLLCSDFGRTWPNFGSSDHWPTTTVAMVGGPWLRTNRMLGGYVLDGMNPRSVGFVGQPVSMIQEGGSNVTRPPTMTDIAWTVQQIFGVHTFLPGGPGEILGVRS